MVTWIRLRGGKRPILRAVLHRTALSIPALFIVSATSFVLLSLTPGDAAEQLLGLGGTKSQYDALRHQLGLDRPLYDQYWHWLTQALQGNFGTSISVQNPRQPVWTALFGRLPVTASLVTGALMLITALGVSMGVYSAVRGGRSALFVDALSLVGFALPVFWLGAILISLFAVKLHWLPAVGYTPLTESASGWLRSLVLPVTAIGITGAVQIAKQTREAMLEALSSEYVRMARACGLARRSVVFRYAFRNALIRVMTILGLLTAGLLGGTVFVEKVFALPGLGRLAADSVSYHDLPMLQGVVVLFTILVIAVNLIVDLLATILDPRVRAK